MGKNNIGTLVALTSVLYQPKEEKMKQCNQNIQDLIDLSEKLLTLSDQGDIDRNDDSCGVLYGVARDVAYKLLSLAQEEREKHVHSEKWD
jgi:hypothetical protein